MPSSGDANLKTTDNSTQLPFAHTTHLVIEGRGPYWFQDYIRCLNICICILLKPKRLFS